MPINENSEDGKQVGFVEITNIPLYKTKCKGCEKPFNTSMGREYCLACRPFPIECD